MATILTVAETPVAVQFNTSNQDLTLDSNRTGRSRRDDLLALLEWQSDAEEWPDRLRRRQRATHGSASKGVAARPRSTMSHR